MTAVCIAGAHRSGTSMITRALNLLGLFLGPESDVSVRAADNPEGFWENIQFVKLNDDILSKQGGAWDMPPPLRVGWELHPSMSPYYHRAQQIIESFKDYTLWGWKDPRNSLTIDFWQRILPNQKVVICIRNPLEVVQSLSKRGYSSPIFGFNLWLLYNEHLLAAISPENRIITHFDSYFINPRAELERISNFLEISVSEEQLTNALASISPRLRHNHVTLAEILDYNPPFELLKLYQTMCFQAGPVYQAVVDNDKSNDIFELDTLFVRRKNITSEPAHSGQEDGSIRIKAALSELETQLADAKSQLADLHSYIQRKENDLSEALKQYSEMNTQLVDAKSQLADLHLYVQRKENDLSEALKQYSEVNNQLANATNQLVAMQLRVQNKENDLSNALKQHSEANAQLANVTNQLAAMQVYIQQKDQDVRIAVSFIEELHRTLGWRMVLLYRSLLDRFAPSGSLRRRIHDLPVSIYRRLKAKSVLDLVNSNSTSEVEVLPQLGDVPDQPGKRLAVCTIVSKNYLSFARIFAESMKRTNPGTSVYVLIVDRVENKFDPDEEPYHVITLDELDNIPNLKHLCFKYTPIELNTAVKPYFLEYLMNKFQIEKICYFDPDIYIFSKLDGVWDLLNIHSLVVTPHITSPYQDTHHPNELEINLAGVFNLGFLGISKTPASASFLEWWKDRLYDYCYMKPSQGMHVDQSWVDFAPVMYDGVFILRDPAYNIAYWNLHERARRLRFENEKLYIDHRPAVFFHFSGFTPQVVERISTHQDRFRLNDLPNVRPIYEFYLDLMEKFNYAKIKQWPYAFGKFDNGIEIPSLARAIYGKFSREQARKFGDPFSLAGEHSFFSWLKGPVDGNRPVITPLYMEMYQVRSDLQQAFPDPLGVDRNRFKNWLMEKGARDFNLDESFIKLDDIPQDAMESRTRNITFITSEFVRTLHRVSKEYVVRVLHPGSYLFQRLRFLNKRYFEQIIDVQTQATLPAPAPLAQKSKPFGVNVAGYITGEFGVAEVSRASLKSLSAVAIPHVLNNVQTQAYRHNDTTFENFSSENPYHINLVHVNADQAHEFAKQKGQAYFQDRYNIGCWFWELSSFPRQWRSSFDYYQEIWVASGFCQESIASQSPIPVVKMTFPILMDDYPAEPNRELFGLPEGKFIYGFVFDYLSLAERKNPFGLIKAFNTAFEKREDVLLVIKTINAEHAPEKAERLRDAAKGCNVQFIDGYLRKKDVVSLLASFDSFVSLHRSEGFGIGMAQAMYLRKPVIATGYSGNMEFMNHNNSFLVRYKLAELQENYGPYEKGNVWAEPDLDHAAELMRLVFENRTFSQQIVERAEMDIKARLTPEVAGREMRSRLLMV